MKATKKRTNSNKLNRAGKWPSQHRAGNERSPGKGGHVRRLKKPPHLIHATPVRTDAKGQGLGFMSADPPSGPSPKRWASRGVCRCS